MPPPNEIQSPPMLLQVIEYSTPYCHVNIMF